MRSFPLSLFVGVLASFAVLGVGCSVSPSSLSVSSTDQIPLPSSTSTQLTPVPVPLAQTVEAWRGSFLDGKKPSALWLITASDETKSPVTRGRFSEVGSVREGRIEQLARTKDGFTFALNWGLEEGEQGTATSTYVTHENGDIELKGEMRMGSSTHSFSLHRDFSLPEFTLVHVSTSTYSGDRLHCEYDVGYPKLTQALGVSESSISAINTKIVQYLSSSTDPLEEQAKAFVQTCEDEIANVLDSESGDSVPESTVSYAQSLRPEIAFVNSHVLSMLFLSYVYSGGAHGEYGYDTLQFNVASGTQLALTDLVRTDALQKMMQRMATKLLSQSKDLLFERDIPAFHMLATNKTKMTSAEQAAKFTHAYNWYLTDKGITFFFNPYEIAPYVAGVIEIEMPFSTWADLATPQVKRWELK